MEQDNRVVGSILDVLQHSLQVQTDRLLVVVSVLLDFQSGVLEDGSVVTPGRCRQVDSLGMRVVSLQEGSSDSESASSRDGLGDGYSSFLDGGRVFAVSQDGGILGELG